MDPLEFLADYRQRAVLVREEIFDHWLSVAQEYSSINVEMVQILKDFCEGGKGVRGALVVLGYRCGKDKVNNEVLKIAVALEIAHAGLLIADDVMDRSDLRRNRLTVHKFYEKELAQRYSADDPVHFGCSMALNLNLMAIFLAEEIFGEVSLRCNEVRRAQRFVNSYLLKTTFGQGVDVARGGNLGVTEEEVLLIHKLKTAFYTVSGPLMVGGLLGGVSKAQLAAMEKFGEKVGVAFQLRDDELGLFGTQEEIGKPVDSDLKEGKNTLLFVRAFKKSNPKQRRILEEAFGNRRATGDQLEKVRQVVMDTGALEYSRKLSRKLVEQGKRYVPKITPESQLRETLYNLAGFLVERKK